MLSIAYVWVNTLTVSTVMARKSAPHLAPSQCSREAWFRLNRYMITASEATNPRSIVESTVGYENFNLYRAARITCQEGYLSILSYCLKYSGEITQQIPSDAILRREIESTVQSLRNANITGTKWPLFDLTIPNFAQHARSKNRYTTRANPHTHRATTALGQSFPSYSEMVGKMQQLYRSEDVYSPENECERECGGGGGTYKIDSHDAMSTICDFKLSYYQGAWNNFTCNPTKNAHIIAVSLFKPAWESPEKPFDQYLAGISVNWAIASVVFPGWTMRIYHDGCLAAKNEQNEDNPYHHLFLTRGIELVDMSVCTREEFNVNPAAWRFLVADDPYVFRYLQRDLDGNITMRDKFAVDEWISLQKPFHVVKDHPGSYFSPILAGLWGGSRVFPTRPSAAVLPPPTMYNRLRRSSSGVIRYNADQEFLALEIWPLMNKTGVVQHDEWTCGRRYRDYSLIPGAIGLPTKRRFSNLTDVKRNLRFEEFLGEEYKNFLVDSDSACNIREDAIEIPYSSFRFDA